MLPTGTDTEENPVYSQTASSHGGMQDNAAPFVLQNAQEVEVAHTATQLIWTQTAKTVGHVSDVTKPEVQAALIKAVQEKHRGEDLFTVAENKIAEIVEVITKQFAAKVIPIPALTITPTAQVSFGFKEFELDLKHWNQQPLSQELLIRELRTDNQHTVIGNASAEIQAQLEDYIVTHLIDMPEVDYDTHADILYNLASQVVSHFKAKHESEEAVRSILQGHGKQMAAAIFADMKKNMWRSQTNYRVTKSAAFQELKPQNFEDSGKSHLLHFKDAPASLSQIKKYIFQGFAKSCYHLAKFDSDTERKLAVLLEADPSVHLWMKPGPNQFKIFDSDGLPYQPDFVVETGTSFFIIETKRADEMKDPTVVRKAEAAAIWAAIATTAQHTTPWSYLLVPHDAITHATTLDGLAKTYSIQPDAELMSRYQVNTEE